MYDKTPTHTSLKGGLGFSSSHNWKIQAQELSNSIIRIAASLSLCLSVSLSLSLSLSPPSLSPLPSHPFGFLSPPPLLLSLPLFSPNQTALGFLYPYLAAPLKKKKKEQGVLLYQQLYVKYFGQAWIL